MSFHNLSISRLYNKINRLINMKLYYYNSFSSHKQNEYITPDIERAGRIASIRKTLGGRADLNQL